MQNELLPVPKVLNFGAGFRADCDPADWPCLTCPKKSVKKIAKIEKNGKL